MNKVSIIVAVADNLAIGLNGQLLWNMPTDMKRFKELTTGHTIIMGRKTFESLPKGALPNRKNIVLTSSSEANYPNTIICKNLEEALHISSEEEEVFIIGGASVYKSALDIADILYLTQVHHSFEADTFFPQIDCSQWEEIEKQVFPADEKNAYPFTFLTYKRNTSSI